MIIGIDYSMNSVGITILDDDRTRFFSVIASTELSSMAVFVESKVSQIKQDALASLDGYTIIEKKTNVFNKKAKNRICELTRWRRQTMVDSQKVSDAVFDLISPFVNDNTTICIENYKIGSNGDQTVQIIEFTKEFLSHLVSTGFPPENLYWVSAPEVKMFAGSGNFTKKKMAEAFLDKKPDHKMTDFMIKNTKSVIISDKNVLKPCEDVVDSYFIAKIHEQRIKEGLYDQSTPQ